MFTCKLQTVWPSVPSCFLELQLKRLPTRLVLLLMLPTIIITIFNIQTYTVSIISIARIMTKSTTDIQTQIQDHWTHELVQSADDGVCTVRVLSTTSGVI